MTYTTNLNLHLTFYLAVLLYGVGMCYNFALSRIWFCFVIHAIISVLAVFGLIINIHEHHINRRRHNEKY